MEAHKFKALVTSLRPSPATAVELAILYCIAAALLWWLLWGSGLESLSGL